MTTLDGFFPAFLDSSPRGQEKPYRKHVPTQPGFIGKGICPTLPEGCVFPVEAGVADRPVFLVTPYLFLPFLSLSL